MEPVKETVVDEDEKELRTELEADGELLDDSGKPLPWNHPKRVRQIYKEAKEGRKVSTVLKEVGLKPSDLPKAIERLQQFETAYAEWEEEKTRGKTTAEDDADAEAAKKEFQKARRQLKTLGVKFVDEENAESEARAEEHKTNTVLAARERITDLLEEAGILTAKMSDEDRADALDEFDFKVGQRLQRDKEAVAAFVRGSLRPIEKITKQLLEGMKTSTKPSGIKNLPPRLGGSSLGGAEKGKKPDSPEPKNIKEAAEQMAEDLRARKREKE
jgi:hypothetical protein